MKTTVATALAVLVALQAWTAALAGDVEQIRLLKAQNKMLRVQVQTQQELLAERNAQLARSKAQNAELKADVVMARKRNAELAAALKAAAVKLPPATKTARHTYKGRPVSARWFDQQYQRFAEKIVLHQGRFHDAGKALLQRDHIFINPPEMAALLWPRGRYRSELVRILQALGKTEALLSIPRAQMGFGHVPAMVIHVSGVGGAKNVDGAGFPDIPLVYVGNHSYVAANGAKRTVQSYRVHRPLTRKEFGEALAAGFLLAEYRKVKKDQRQVRPGDEPKYRADKWKRKWVRGKLHSVWREEIVAVPIP